jgi:hypothetical protein
MMGCRLHIPNVRPQVNGRQLKSLTYPCASSQWRHYLVSPHLTHVMLSRDMLPDTLDRDNTQLPLNSNHSRYCFSKYLSPSRVLKKI